MDDINKKPAEQATQTPAPPSAEPKPFVWDEWEKQVPQEAWQRIHNHYEQQFELSSKKAQEEFQEKWGDLYELAEKLEKNPKRRDFIKKLTDDEYADYLATTATEAWPDFRVTKAEPVRDEQLVKEVETLKSSISEREAREAQDAYNHRRADEAGALVNDFNDFKFQKMELSDPAYALLHHVVTIANERTDYNRLRGIKNAYVPLRQVWDEYRALQQARNANTPVAPTTTQIGPTESQTPVKSEADALRKTLKKIDSKERISRLMQAMEDINAQKNF